MTKHNLKEISFLVKQLFSANFFVGDYTPFNWYKVDHITEVYQFFENLIQVKLPNFLDKLIKDELNNSYEYNYFKENPEEGIFHRSICFSFNDFYIILKNFKNLKEELFPKENTKNILLQKTYIIF